MSNKQTTQWARFEHAVPVPCLQMIVVDPSGRVLLLHRSEKVRSVRNVWSLPSGLHDVGETMEECAKRELKEEFSLEAYGAMHHVAAYDNIVADGDGGQSWHWLLNLVVLTVPDVTSMVNNEPDKHDMVDYVDIMYFGTPEFFAEFPFHHSFMTWALPNIKTALSKISHPLFSAE